MDTDSTIDMKLVRPWADLVRLLSDNSASNSRELSSEETKLLALARVVAGPAPVRGIDASPRAIRRVTR